MPALSITRSSRPKAASAAATAAIDAVGIPHVGGDEDPAELAGGAAARRIHVGDDDAVAASGAGAGDCCADPTGATGDEDDA